MTTSRREFLLVSAAATGTWMFASQALQAHQDKTPKKLKLLVLGGTGFLGPAIVEAGTARGHQMTLFNRGKTRPELFPDVEKLRGDRDPKTGEGLKALEGRSFDAVFDDCGYYPRMVRASAELLAPHIKQYVYVSSISCYADNSKENCDESSAVATMDDPTLETMGKNYEYYGALKALCEKAAMEAVPDGATIVRPGYIVGPGDPTDRFTYWPVRVARGGEVLAPGAPTDPIQVIDVRDLAEWMLHLAETGTTGSFNACGPERRLTMSEVLEACKTASGSDAKFTWVNADFLLKQGEDGDGSLPIWAPYQDKYKGIHTWSNARAIKAGLKFRPIATTAKDTLIWFRTLPKERQDKLKAGPSAEREVAMLTAWHQQSNG
jgi:2'-hydroxyisoflavone reductase